MRQPLQLSDVCYLRTNRSEGALNILGVSAETWFPVLTLVIGIVLKGVLDALSDKRTARREREARNEERRDAIRLRRVDNQRATLLEFQEAVSTLIRCAASAHLQDFEAHKKGAEWQKNLISNDLAEALRLAQMRVNLLRVRVQSEQIRELAKVLVRKLTELSMTPNLLAAEAALQHATRLTVELQESAGTALRSLDHDESQIVDDGK